jgi:hypothetical protein
MPLMNCPICGHGTSAEAEACPKCGHPNRLVARAPPGSDKPRADTAKSDLSPRTPGGPTCFRCGSGAQRSCTMCGQFYCPRHGGRRLVWVTDGSQKPPLAVRFSCDECAPNQKKLMRILLVLVLLAIVAVLVVGLYL